MQNLALVSALREGMFAQIFNSPRAYGPSLHSLQSLICVRLTIGAFWKNGSFTEHVPQEISGACVDTKLRSMHH